MAERLGEELLDAWVDISISVINERLVTMLTYKEALVCNVLRRAGSVVGSDAPGLTATELCRATSMVKSQMNGILTSLEEKQVVRRTRSAQDRRRIEVLLDDGPNSLYRQQHEALLELVDRISRRLGADATAETIETLGTLAKAADVEINRQLNAER